MGGPSSGNVSVSRRIRFDRGDRVRAKVISEQPTSRTQTGRSCSAVSRFPGGAILKTAYSTLQAADQEVTLERERRNVVQAKAYGILVDYRKAVLGTFDPLDALVASLPRLSPDPGSTPDAPTASGAWDVATQMAKITFTASTSANIDHYELRMSPGPDYSTENETVVASLSPSDPLEFVTNAGLTSPGDVASFKVYVVTTTGNEAGSNAVTVTRL